MPTVATGPMIMTPAIVAICRHWSTAPWIAPQIPSMYVSNCFPISSAEPTWYLFRDSSRKRFSGMFGGTASSPG